ncbi:methyltransferase domain-containing protein [Amnibacterium flavum]|uniref:SAM-dependent methyltransferase n=1 Tax=Amnibacterium flavum TaxID=2173173 RepID=A0A2V1HSJ1_9MICO|nr:methyltransferase domain-containing protein [Amnibacterium flavum]PVZ94009.1 SAM-dependent methyltransferase [Amnibacterium flavum]
MENAGYVHGHHESVLRSHSWRTVENSAHYLIHHLHGGFDILDVGSGPGTISVDLADRVAPGRVVGVDAAESVVRGARELAESRGLRNVRFVTGDAYDLPFQDDTFDIAHAHQVLQHLEDPIAVLREMARVVKPGGIVAARDVDYGGSIWYPASDGLAEWKDLYDRVARAGGGEPDAGRRLLAWAHEAGFAEVVATGSIWAFSSDEDRAWWGGLWADRVIESDFAARAIAIGATQADLQRIADAWRAWSANPDGWFSFPHGEIIATVR